MKPEEIIINGIIMIWTICVFVVGARGFRIKIKRPKRQRRKK